MPGRESGQASNHYELFAEDHKLARELGHNAHRFSLEWAKIEPEPGKIDYQVVEHYHKVYQSLRDNQLTPITTLWHFTLPQWFIDLGGFTKKENIRHFTNYCKFVGQTFKSEMGIINTINEPEVYVFNCYVSGEWPPQVKGLKNWPRLIRNLAIAHRHAYYSLKKINPEFQISVAKNNQVFRPDRKYNFLDNALTWWADYHWNYEFLRLVKNELDYIGLNYYFYHCLRYKWNQSKGKPAFFQLSYPTAEKTDLDWEVYPKGLYLITKKLWQKYHKPILITEHGFADSQDRLRANGIREGLEWLLKSKNEGTQLMGYLHWSLIDNFEWAESFKPRFGLIEVNYSEKFRRTIRPSALAYKEYIAEFAPLFNSPHHEQYRRKVSPTDSGSSETNRVGIPEI